ncbi:MAG: phenylalanine--tRNA ligase subunit beta, partial [Muribaculaceae bacterium]|nr:phenylalanine--tRNA ligase subunit beta [Muribaculaceae bacterium]
NPPAQPTPEHPRAPNSQGSRLALWLTGDMLRTNWHTKGVAADIYDLKAIVANIMARLGINAKEVTLNTTAPDDIYSAGITIATRSGKTLGTMGIVAKPILKLCDIKQPTVFAELDWDALVKLALKRKVTYAPLPKTQPVKRDLALLLDQNITMDQVEAAVREGERKMLRSIQLFDVYEGDKLPAGKKSYAIAMTLQDDERTLTDQQIDAAMQRIITSLQRRLNAELR